jgi:multidrug efflux pump subunit AcrA (membrane-fusion protein)
VNVTAKVGGVIGTINVQAGGSIGADSPLCTINETDRGYTLKISVTNDQAKQVKIGDPADLVNYWGGDITAKLESIANDPQNPGKNKLLVFRLSGDGLEPDTNLTLSIGQKSANYDTLVPNAAVRSDNNGSFVLVVVAKSSPLGNRYTATRVNVQVLASDDTNTAVSGLTQGDFVVTTSTKPIEAGTQVRLVDNG